MEWLAIRYYGGEMRSQSREYREELLEQLHKTEGRITSRVERTFACKKAADNYCRKINEVNRLIEKI